MNSKIKEVIKKVDESNVIDYKLEKEVTLIVDASVRVKCSFITRSKALLIYHHFKRCIDETKYDPYLVAIACLDLSAKYHEEEDVPLDAIVLVFYGMFEQGTCRQDEKFKKIKKSVTTMEIVVMRMLEFSLSHKLAHEYDLYFLHDLQDEFSQLGVWSDVTETSQKMMSDFYLSNRCLNYKAKEIAAAVIEAALYLAGIEVHDRSCHLTIWLKSLSDNSKTLDIIEDIFKICNVGPYAERMHASK